MCFTRAIVRKASLPSNYIHILKRKHVKRNNGTRHAFLDLEKNITTEGFCFKSDVVAANRSPTLLYLSIIHEELRFSIVTRRLF